MTNLATQEVVIHLSTYPVRNTAYSALDQYKILGNGASDGSIVVNIDPVWIIAYNFQYGLQRELPKICYTVFTMFLPD